MSECTFNDRQKKKKSVPFKNDHKDVNNPVKPQLKWQCSAVKTTTQTVLHIVMFHKPANRIITTTFIDGYFTFNQKFHL